MSQQPPPPASGASPYQRPSSNSGPNTIQVVVVVAVVTLLVGVLAYFLVLRDTESAAGSESPTTALVATTVPTTTAPAATTVPTTTAPAAPATAAPTTVLVPAQCVSEEMSLSTQGRRDEIALYQQILKGLGYDPGEVDGYFGPKSFDAGWQEVLDNGFIDGPQGIFEEAVLDDGAILMPAFERLGIACLPSDFTDAEEQD